MESLITNLLLPKATNLSNISCRTMIFMHIKTFIITNCTFMWSTLSVDKVMWFFCLLQRYTDLNNRILSPSLAPCRLIIAWEALIEQHDKCIMWPQQRSGVSETQTVNEVPACRLTENKWCFINKLDYCFNSCSLIEFVERRVLHKGTKEERNDSEQTGKEDAKVDVRRGHTPSPSIIPSRVIFGSTERQ